MALRKAKAPLTKVTGLLYTDDWKFLRETLPASGAFVFVRDLVHARVAELRARIAESRRGETVDVET